MMSSTFTNWCEIFKPVTLKSTESLLVVSYNGSSKGTLICTGPCRAIATLIASFIKTSFSSQASSIKLIL